MMYRSYYWMFNDRQRAVTSPYKCNVILWEMWFYNAVKWREAVVCGSRMNDVAPLILRSFPGSQL